MRLILRCGLVRDTGKELSILHAAAEAESGGARWYGASFDLKTVIAGLSLALTLMVQHVATQNSITRLQADVEAEKSSRLQAQRPALDRITALEAKIVDRHEIDGNVQHLSDRIALQQMQIQQLFTLQLGRGGR